MLLSTSKPSQTSKLSELVIKTTLIVKCHRVTGLSNVLRDIEDGLAQQVLSDWQQKVLASVLEECHNTLIALGKVVD